MKTKEKSRGQLRRDPGDTPAQATKGSSALGSVATVSFLLALATFICYFAVRNFGFVDYDDGDYVNGNRPVESGLTWWGVKWAFTTGHASNWHPLTWLSHMLDYQLFGHHIGAHHLTSLALHALNTILLFLLLRRMTGAHWRSAMVAALFALHPIHVESVAWLSERKDVLSTLFLLLTLMAYARYAGRLKEVGPTGDTSGAPTKGAQSQRERPASFYYVLALALFAMGLMSKPMLVTTPFLLLLLDYWPLRRIESPKGLIDLHRLRGLLLEKIPFFVLSAGSSVVTFIVQREGGAVSTALTLDQRIGNALVSYVRYLKKTLWPGDLAVLYPHPGSWPVWMVAGSGLILLALFAAAFWFVRQRPYVTVGWLWFFGTLIPVIGLVQVGIQAMADRYSYVPLIGIFIAVVWGISDLALERQWSRQGLATVAAIGLLACSLLTMRQVQFWTDTETLFTRAVEVEPRNYLAYNNLGYFAENQGRGREALEYYRKSIEINSNYVDALNNFGHALAAEGRNSDAISYYERALRVDPNHVEVHNNLGNALSELGKLDEAIADYRFALQHKPDHADAHNNLGIALAMQGKLDDAVPHFREAIRLKPNYASAHSNLGNAFAAQKKWDEAIAEYKECLRLNPDDPRAHNNLANVLSQQGKLDEAIPEYSRALTLNSNNPEAHFNLGVALLRQNKRDEARTHFLEALKLRPNYVEAQRQLAALSHEPGK